MSNKIDEEKLESLAKELAKGVRSEQDVADLSRTLLKMTVETALGAGMEEHLGYAPHEATGRHSGNSRNGHSMKRLKGDHGEVEITTPRDRNASFEPQIVRKKGQSRLTQFDDQILALYAKGLSLRDIVATFQEMSGAEVPPTLVSKVTEAVIERVEAWQSRPLDGLYPIVYLDGLVVKVRQDKRVINKTIHLALGLNLRGEKALLGLWLAETEGAKYWRSSAHRAQEPGSDRYFHRCGGRIDGFSGRHRGGVPRYPDPAVHRAQGAQFAEVRVLEGPQGGEQPQAVSERLP